MNYSSLLSFATVFVAVLFGLSMALPPFEIRSSNSQPSEGAEEWLTYLNRKGVCPHHQVVCPSSDYFNTPKCVGAEQLCDRTPDCPRHEDESAALCLYFRLKEDRLANGHL